MTLSEPGLEAVGREEVAFPEIVAFFRRNAALIFGSALAAGALTALAVVLFVPRSFEASANLVIVPPRFASELKPPTLTVQAYQTLLESDAVVAEARERLVAAGVLGAEERLRIGKELQTRIFVSRRAEETTLAPMLQIVARGRTAAAAARIANVWAEVFLERVRELVAGTTSADVQLIERQYPEARERLAELENARATAANEFQRRLDQVATAWDERTTRYRTETGSLLASYQAETTRVLEKRRSELNMLTREAQLTSLRTAYADLQNEQARVRAQLDQKELELTAARRQLAATPPYLLLQKAITDDALWQSVATSGKETAAFESLKGKTLTTQEINPLYTEIASRTARIESEVNALTPRAAQLEGQLSEMAEALKVLEGGVGADRASVEALKREREAGLAKLEAERATGLAALERQRQQELDAIARERDTRLGQLDRDIQQHRDLFSQLAASYNQAVLAKAGQDVEDVRLAAAAVPPLRPRSRDAGVKGILMALLGAIVATAVAAVGEGLRRGTRR